MVRAICPPEGIWSLGVRVNVRVEELLTYAPLAEIAHAAYKKKYIERFQP